MQHFLSDYEVVHAESAAYTVNLVTWLKAYFRDIRSDLKNINPNFTNRKFGNNYTYKIKH